jgi:hypothetical protein
MHGCGGYSNELFIWTASMWLDWHTLYLQEFHWCAAYVHVL